MTDKTPKQTFLSISLATMVTVVITNPLDIVKVRLQTDTKNCPSMPQGNCIYHKHSQQNLNFIRNSSIIKLWSTPNLKSFYKIACECLPLNKNTSALIYIIRNEGAWALTKGVKQGLTGALISSTLYFSFYESIRKEIKNYSNHHILLPLYSSLIARSITTFITFPFEYLRTVQQSQKSGNISFKKNYGAGFMALYQRELLFSSIYWVLVENIRSKIKTLSGLEEEYRSKSVLLLSNIIAGASSGGIASVVTLPLDVVKTRRQVSPASYKSKSSSQILREIYQSEGVQALFSGLRQRLIRTMLATSTVLTLYELFSDIMKKNQILM